MQKYLPVLNTIFKSNFGQIQSYDSLYEILRLRKLQLDLDKKYIGINLYLYEYFNGQVSTNYPIFSSINELSKKLGIARETISLYLNTYVPYKDFLFLTNKIESFDLVDKLIKDAMHGLNLNNNLPKKNRNIFYKI